MTEPEVRALLRWTDGSGKRQALQLSEGNTAQIGREAGSDLPLNNAHISRHHALIAWRNGAFEVSDLGSINGTEVNGQRIAQPHVLKDGDVIRLHDVDLTFYEVREQAPERRHADVQKTFVVQPTAGRPRFIVSAGTMEGREFPLSGDKIVIGRATAKDQWEIALRDRAMSRPHAQLERQAENFVLSDLGSANGTLVNGRALTEPAALQDGDVILLGETTLLFRSR